ncbi:MAG: hypothetical protein Q9183_006125 [Haloplaca sp. 2 TL-2023]
MFTLDLPGLQNSGGPPEEDEVEGETLGQRLRRLKAKKDPHSTTRTISGDFASEIMSQFGGLGEQPKPAVNGNAQPQADGGDDSEEETLAQRRARLQAGKAQSRNVSGESSARPTMNKRRSMADILQAHPAAGAGSRVASNDRVPLPSSHTPKTPWTMQVQQRALSGEQGGYHYGGYANEVHSNGHRNGGVPNPMMFNGLAAQNGVPEVRNREMIDRWRQSVRY